MKDQDHPLIHDLYGHLCSGVNELAPQADAMRGFALVVWDSHGNTAVLQKRIDYDPFGPDQVLSVVKGALINARTSEALN